MNTIRAPQTGRQLDADLRAILSVLESAEKHNGKVLYIHEGQIDFADGEDMFDIIPLTEDD